MMKAHKKEGVERAAFHANRPALRVVFMPASLLFLVMMLSCTGGQKLLSERLLSTDDRTKRAAFKEMDALDIPSRGKYLVIMKDTLRAKNPDYRILAVESLGRIGLAAEEAVPDIIAALHDENDAVRLHAVKALGEIGPVAVPSLIPALNHQDQAVRCGAADALGSIGPRAKEAVPALVNLLSDQDYTITRHAASALGLIGPDVSALTEVARRGDNHAIDMALTVFSQLKADPGVVHELIRLLGDENENPGVRGFAVKALGKMQEKAQEAMPDLAHALGDENDNVRTAARWALSQMGRAAVPALRGSLTSDNPQVRSGAAYALGCMGQAAEDAVPALLQTMKDESPVVRIDAISALDKIQASSRAVAKALIQVLDEDHDDFVRLTAARVLNKIGTYEAKEAVSKYNKKNGLQN